MSEPLVSVIITNYNYGRFLPDAIESSLGQTSPGVEVIVVDDGSTDDSIAVMRQYGERIIPVAKANGGQMAAINAGFAASHGQILCLLDSDDWLMPEKVAIIVDAFRRYPAIESCFHGIHVVDASGTELSRSRLTPTGVLDFRAGVKRGVMPFIATTTSGLSFRRSLLERICPLPERDHLVSDLYLKWVALALAPTCFLADALATQRIHGANAYTLKGDAAGRARQFIVCADWMREAFPDVLARWADNAFAQGLGTSWRLGGIAPDVRENVRRYLAQLSPRARSEVLARALGWRLGVDRLYSLARTARGMLARQSG